jgi:hypothetical protein
LVIVPSLVGRLLLGEELTSIAIAVERVTGIALISLGVACWPARRDAQSRALLQFYGHYCDTLKVECLIGSGG